MKNSALVLLIVLLNLNLAVADTTDRMQDGFPELPKDARDIAERSVACQHFWGEANGNRDERDKQVSHQLKQLKCNRIKKDLERIRVKYRKSDTVLKVLEEAALE